MAKLPLLPLLLLVLSGSARAQCTLLQLEEMSPDTVAVVPSIAGKPVPGPSISQGAIRWTAEQARARFDKFATKPAGPLSAFAGAWKRVGEVVEGSTGTIDMSGFDVEGYGGRLAIVDQGHAFADAGQATIQGEAQAASIRLEHESIRFATTRQERTVTLQTFYLCRKPDEDSLLCFSFTKRPILPNAANKYWDYELVDKHWLAYARLKQP